MPELAWKNVNEQASTTVMYSNVFGFIAWREGLDIGHGLGLVTQKRR